MNQNNFNRIINTILSIILLAVQYELGELPWSKTWIGDTVALIHTLCRSLLERICSIVMQLVLQDTTVFNYSSEIAESLQVAVCALNAAIARKIGDMQRAKKLRKMQAIRSDIRNLQVARHLLIIFEDRFEEKDNDIVESFIIDAKLKAYAAYTLGLAKIKEETRIK